jgi:hypothetical protein
MLKTRIIYSAPGTRLLDFVPGRDEILEVTKCDCGCGKHRIKIGCKFKIVGNDEQGPFMSVERQKQLLKKFASKEKC